MPKRWLYEAGNANLPIDRGARGDSIYAFPLAAESYEVACVEQDPTTGRTLVTLRHWDPDEPMDRPLNWNNSIAQGDVQDLIDGGWREIETLI